MGITNKDAIAILKDCLDKAEYKYGAYGVALKMAIEALQEKSNILSEYEKLVDSLEDATPKEASQIVDDFCITTMREMLADHYSKMILAEDKSCTSV